MVQFNMTATAAHSSSSR